MPFRQSRCASEKIQLHRLLGKQSLQLMNLLAQRSAVSAGSGRLLTGLDNLQFRPPLVQASSRDAEFLGQFTHVVASAHSFDSHPLKLTRVSLPLHFAALSLQSVPTERLSIQGCIPRVG